jgi:orotidine-5'-phosphate decarboxylase
MGAGCDLLLYCSDLDRALGATRAMAESAAGSRTVRSRLQESADRVDRLARAWPATLDGAVVGPQELAAQFDPFRRLV